MTSSQMKDNKKKLIKFNQEKNFENLMEVILAFRVNALQIAPELRKSFVYELLKVDIFCIEESKDNTFVIDLLAYHAYNLRHATLSLISIISSTFKGVEYLLTNGCSIIEKVIDVSYLHYY